MRCSYPLFLVIFLFLASCSKPADPYVAYQKGDYKTAIKGFGELAKQNDKVALAHLGVMSQLGLGTGKDLHKAIRYYQQAAEQGYAPAQYNLGLLYQSGQGVQKDYSIAYELFTLAGQQKHRKAKAAAERLLTELKVTFPQTKTR